MSKAYSVSELEIELNQLLSEIKFVKNQDEDKFERLVELYEVLYSKTKNVMHLINLCRLEKKMLGRHGALSKLASKKAFKAKPIEKTLYFHLASNISNLPVEQSLLILEETFENIVDKNLIAIKDLYLGCLYSLQKDFVTYNRFIHKSKLNYKPGMYWQLESVVSDFYCGLGEDNFLSEDVDIKLPNFFDFDFDFIVSVSCDMRYFDYYSEFFLKTLFEKNTNCLVHLYIVNCIDEEYVELQLKKMLGNDRFKVVVNYFSCPENIDYKPVSAVLRLLAINSLLEKYKKPVFFGEIDAVILGDLNYFVEDTIKNESSQMVREIGSYLPWQRFTCGFGLYLNTKSGVSASRLLLQYIKGIFNYTNKHYWADQCALEASIRYSLLVDAEYDYYSMSVGKINEYIVTPTGADLHEKKISILRSYI